MPIGQQIQAWRLSRGQSVDDLATESGLLPHVLDEIESEVLDPSAALLEALAAALKIPLPGSLAIQPRFVPCLTTQRTRQVPPRKAPILSQNESSLDHGWIVRSTFC